MSISETLAGIAGALAGAARPAVLWSGGKDSTALLHLVRGLRPDVEVILWRVPWLPAKWEFHERIARAWGLTVWDFPPAWSAVCHGNGRMDLMEAYQVGAQALVVARGTEVFDPCGPWVCGRKWLERPKAAGVEFPWDVVFHGHKSVDVDPCSGNVPLRVDVLEPVGCARIYYPLRDWSDEDVTAYSLENGVPWDGNRYELADGVLRSLADKNLNSDYYHACMRCIDRREGPVVRCPLSGLDVENLSGRVQVYEPVHEYCGLRVEGNGV
jgi:3'-phosphoadenosine 5'-phosphosulfate sulfotransferase (PAPS reductase)/FAD synthetase